MTISIKAIESLRVLVESSFCADGTGSLGSYTFVPFNEGTGTVALNTLELDPNFVLQRRADYRENVLGPRMAQLKFTMNLSPTGTAAAAAVTAITSALGIMLKAVMGGEDLGTGTTFSSGWTAITGDVASGSGITPGAFIGWTNSSGIVEWRQVKSKTSNTLVLSHGFSGSPAASDVCYACATYYVTENPTQTLQFIVSGQESTDRWLVLGAQCEGGFEIAIDPSGKSIPTITFNFTGALYYDSTQTAGSITGTITPATYSAYSPIVEYVGDYQMFTVGTPTYTATASRVHVSALTWKPATKYIRVTSPSSTAAAHGGTPIYAWRAGALRPPLEASFVTFMDSLKWWNARDAKGDYCQQYTTGVAAGAALVLAAPTVQVLNPQRSPSDQEIEGQTVMLKARANSDTALTTDIAKSPYLIAVG